ncbi:MAG: diguanylate cyclase, partial [Nanoarchaeota archaeon]|nr:diguanylate cyclase [Nanoarchaeota archaeon]
SIIKEKEKEIEFLSTHDYLTKLPNRLSLHNHLKDLIIIPNNHFAIVYIDLDDFKSINDTAGHYIGDLVLISFANKIKSIIKKTDFISRISGDEFVLVLDGVNNEIDLEKILKKLSETKVIVDISEYQFTVNFSIGAVLYPQHTTNFNELLKFADIALYETKNKNKSSYTIYHPFQLNQVLRKLELIQEIKFCVERKELFLKFQPQVNIKTGEAVGIESLVRWNSIYFGEISPSIFIKIAEESNAILDIGEFVIEESIKTIAKWKNANLKYPKVAINFSIRQLEQNNIVDIVEKIRNKYNIESSKIEIEITESIMMNKRTIIIDNLFRFKNLGYSIALDDFGTGFSSITYLSQLPINKIK